MGCSNCFNGCAEIVSDQCVKYTGIDVPVLGIQKGDSLSYVEQALIEFLTSTLDGTGIKIDIPSEIICELVQKYLPECGDITVVDLITALIKAACDLQIQVDEVKTDILLLNADYTIECLTGVTPSSNTHEIVQAIIDKLCALDVDFAAFVLDVTTNYVKKSELNSLIQAYIDSTTSAVTQQYQKMVPYTVVEYYGPLSNFDGSGAGIALLGWDKIYICNGQVVGSTVTPDKRGRIAVGAIQGVPGGALDPVVQPGGFNPNYALYGTAGANSVQLTTNQMPSHIHGAVSSVTETPHTHFTTALPELDDTLSASNSIQQVWSDAGSLGYALRGSTAPTVGLTSATSTGITVGTIIGSAGNGQPHPNIPPVLACYYIMYIP
jgi:microcystin-dependent protein